MSALLKVECFDLNGTPTGTVDIALPEYLDWAPLRIKAEWFRRRGSGDPRTKTALLMSQGERGLFDDMDLTPLDYKQLKENLRGAEENIRGRDDWHTVPRGQ